MDLKEIRSRIKLIRQANAYSESISDAEWCADALEELLKTTEAKMINALDRVTFNEATSKESMEAILDAFGTERFKGWLIDICMDKAEHVRSAWGDDGSAWELLAKRLERVSWPNPYR